MPSRGRRTSVALTAFLWAGNRKQVNTGKDNCVGSGKEEHGKSASLPAWTELSTWGKCPRTALESCCFPTSEPYLYPSPSLSSSFSLLPVRLEALGFSAGLLSDFGHLREMRSVPSSAETHSVPTIWCCLQCKHFLQHLPTQLNCSGLS